MNVEVQGPDGNTYQFPDGTDKAAAIGYFKKKGIGAPKAEAPEPAPNQGLPEGELPLDSYTNATLQGLSTIGGGAIHAVQGMGHMLAHPIDTAKSLYNAPGELLNQAKQVPGAISDINESADPAGTYAKVAGDTAGEGAGQAIVAAATPELPGMAKDAVTGAGPKAKALAKVAGQDAVSRIPVAGRLVRRPSIGDYIDAARAKAPAIETAPADDLTPIQKWWKERGGTLASERPNGPIRAPRPRPSVPPEGGPAINIAPEAGPAIPTGAPEAPAIDTSPKRVGSLLNDSLGGKALKPDVPLRQQGQHIPVESSAMKSYKYDPAAKELEVASPSGAISIHGDVSPEQAQAFENATSKGRAWNELKKNSTFVGKIVNGKRVNVKPPKGMASASPDDLTGILTESLRRAQQ